MPSCPFIDPTRETRLLLSGDEWIVIHDELSVGQRRDMVEAMRSPVTKDIDRARYPEARAGAYLVRWSFRMANGDPAPVTAGAIEMLTTSRFDEITAALNAHEAALEEKKLIPNDATVSDPILRSVAS